MKLLKKLRKKGRLFLRRLSVPKGKKNGPSTDIAAAEKPSPADDGWVEIPFAIGNCLDVDGHDKMLYGLEANVHAQADKAILRGNFEFAQGGTSPVEATIGISCRRICADISAQVMPEIKNFTADRDRILRELTGQTIEQRKAAQLAALKAEKDRELAALEAEHDSLPGKRERMEDLREEIRVIMRAKEKEAGKMPLAMSLAGSEEKEDPRRSKAALFALFGLDAIAVFYAIRDSQAIPVEFAALMTLAISGCLGLAAKSVAEAWAHGNRQRLYLWGGIAATLLGAIFILRLQAGNGFLLPLLLLIFFGVGVAISFAQAKDGERADLTTLLEDKKKELTALEAEVKRIEEDYESNKTAIEEKYDEKAAKGAEKKVRRLERMAENQDIAIGQLHDYHSGIAERIGAIHESAIGHCRESVRWARERERLPEVTYEAPVAPPCGNVAKPATEGGPVNGRANGTVKRMVMLVLTAASLSLTACAGPPVSKECTVIVDVTEAAGEAPHFREALEKLPSTVLDMLGVDTTSKVQDGLRIRLCIIKDRSMPPCWEVTLREWPQSGRIYPERDKEFARFMKDYRDMFKQLPALTEGGLRQTVAYHTLCQQLTLLAGSRAEVRKVIWVSDAIENDTAGGLSLYSYKDDPARIMAERDKIAAQLDSICGMPRLDGISALILHSPEVDDALFRKCSEFWQWHLAGKGATVSFGPFP